VGNTLLLLRKAPLPGAAVDGPLVGRSAAVRRIIEDIDLVAPSEVCVLIQGESGTGKEIAARLIHARSGRGGPYVAVNCAAIPESLAESALFGHHKGAFTGADESVPGAFVEAEGGTLLLDDVCELPLGVQPKLLRAIETREVQPLGRARTVQVDARLIATSGVDLRATVGVGRFRGDLCARLEGWVISFPPLARRKEDVPLLVKHFAERGAGPPWAPSVDLLEAMLCCAWPFNVRELEHACSMIGLALRGRSEASIPDLPEAVSRIIFDREALPDLEPGEVPRKEALRRVMEHSGWSVETAARYYGKGRRTVYRWLSDYGLKVPTRRGRAKPDAVL
jgi:two-component system response regulator HydG